MTTPRRPTVPHPTPPRVNAPPKPFAAPVAIREQARDLIIKCARDFRDEMAKIGSADPGRLLDAVKTLDTIEGKRS